MKWWSRVLGLLHRRAPAVDQGVARARAARWIAQAKRAHVNSLWPQSEQAHDDLEALIEQALRGREDG